MLKVLRKVQTTSLVILSIIQTIRDWFLLNCKNDPYVQSKYITLIQKVLDQNHRSKMKILLRSQSIFFKILKMIIMHLFLSFILFLFHLCIYKKIKIKILPHPYYPTTPIVSLTKFSSPSLYLLLSPPQLPIRKNRTLAQPPLAG